MERFLTKVGLCAIIVSVVILIKRIDDYYYFKKLNPVRYRVDEDEE